MNFSKKVLPFFSERGESYLNPEGERKLIKFSIGNPPPEGFPKNRIEAISARILREEPNSVLDYSEAAGMSDFKRQIRNFLNRRGFIVAGPGDIITVTTGAQQAIALAVQLFCDDGDIVLVESPTFMVALDTIRSMGAVPVGVKMQEDGIDLNELEEKMSMTPKPRLLYTIPDFHNPMGVCLSEHKRKEICRLAYEYEIPVLEDNPYYELRYDGKFLPYLKQYDTHGMVALTSSMSKIIAPGMRTGYVVAPGRMGLGYEKLKTAVDFHSNSWAQKVCSALLEEGMDDDIARLREIYRGKGQLMMECLEKYLPSSASFTHPQGGMFIWVTLPNNADAKAFSAELLKKGVLVMSGGQYFADEGAGCSSFRLSYSLATEEEIRQGCEIIGTLAREYCE